MGTLAALMLREQPALGTACLHERAGINVDMRMKPRFGQRTQAPCSPRPALPLAFHWAAIRSSVWWGASAAPMCGYRRMACAKLGMSACLPMASASATKSGAVDPTGENRALISAAIHGRQDVPDWLRRVGQGPLREDRARTLPRRAAPRRFRHWRDQLTARTLARTITARSAGRPQIQQQ